MGNCYSMKKLSCFFSFRIVIVLMVFLTPSSKTVAVADARAANVSASIDLFDNTRDFQIVKTKRGITKQSSATDTLMCRGWSIAAKNLTDIIRDCRTTKPEDWHHEFDVLPCVIQGTIRQEGQDFLFEVNAGSWIYVRCKSKTVILGCYDKRYEQYFVSHAWTGEEN